MNHKIDKNEFKKSVVANVRNLYRKNIEEATAAQVYHAVALAVKDMIIDRWIATHEEYDKQITGADLRSVQTIEELYNVVENK